MSDPKTDREIGRIRIMADRIGEEVCIVRKYGYDLAKLCHDRDGFFVMVAWQGEDKTEFYLAPDEIRLQLEDGRLFIETELHDQ